MSTRFIRGRAFGAAGILALTGASLVAAMSPASAAGTFNGAGVTVAGNAATTSAIVVAGQDTVTDVNVVVNGLTTNFTQVVDAVLESPSGAKVMLLSDVACSNAAANSTFGIDDAGQTPFPGAGTGAASAPVVNGIIYQPTDLDPAATPCDGTGDVLVPAPTASALSAFNGSNPNGTWKLHFASDSAGTSASIQSWSLTLNTPTNGCDSKLATIVGTDGANKINGTAGNDVIVAGGGKDVVKGLGGNDTICGGLGKDVLKGGAGDDRIFGESGKDQIKGSAGADNCVGGTSKDSFSGCEARVQ